MNILLINHYAGNPKLGMEFRPYYLAREWVKTGNKVLIVGGSYSHLRKQQPTEERENIEGIEYCWIPLKPYKGNGLGRIKSMFDFVRKLWFNYKTYLGDFKPDVVIASSTYPLDIYPAHRIAKHYGAKLVYEVHDLWPLSPMELGGYSKYHPFIMVMQVAEDYCYRHADKVVSLLPKALDHMKERGMAEEKFVYIPNGFDPQEWENVTNPVFTIYNLIERLKREGKVVVMYAGGHAISNALDIFLDSMKLIKDKNIIAILIGNGQEKARLSQRVQDENINNIIFLDPVSKNEIPSVLALADFLFIGWQKNHLYDYGICPNKLLDYMMSGRPIIHSVSAPNDWVKDSGCGMSIEAENSIALADAIVEMSELPESERQKMGKRGLEYCKSKFTYSDLANQFINSIEYKTLKSNMLTRGGVSRDCNIAIEELLKLREQGNFIVGFAGAHGIANSLYSLIDAVAALKDTDTFLTLFGTGNEKEKLISYVLNKQINNVKFFNPVAKDAIPYILTYIDCLYIGLKKQPLFRFGISPNKMFDYMMAARPVIQAIDAGNNMVEEAGDGIYVEPDNVNAIKDAIIRMKGYDELSRFKMGMMGRRYALAHHAYPILAERFLSAIR